MILIQQCLVLKLHVTPRKCNHFLANVAKKVCCFILFAYRHIRTCLTIKTFFTALHDTNIYSCLGSASRTKYQKIQNDRKYKHQFVFQVYNILFTKIGREEKGLQPHILSWGDYFASSSPFFP